MRKIVTFDEFSRINESVSPDMDPQVIKLIRDLGNLTTKRLVNTLISLPQFGGFTLKHLSNNQHEVFYKWNGQDNSMGIIYDPTKGGNVIHYGLRFSFTPEAMPKELPQHQVNGIFRSHVWNKMDSLIKDARDSAKDFNPFDSGLESLPILKDLEKHGAQIVSTPIERKNGTVAIKFGNSESIYTIQKSGYIRRKGISGYLTDHPDLIYPITTTEDLIPKIVYVFNTHLKDRASMEGVPKDEINDLISELNTDDGTSSDSYKDKFEEMISKHPGMSVYLPSPENWEDNGIKQGARILGRLGIF
jgi:hypothetical protein